MNNLFKKKLKQKLKVYIFINDAKFRNKKIDSITFH